MKNKSNDLFKTKLLEAFKGSDNKIDAKLKAVFEKAISTENQADNKTNQLKKVDNGKD